MASSSRTYLLLDEIRRRREAGDAPRCGDVLSMLLLARNDAGEGLTDAELRDGLATLVLAGHETTGTALSWALECLLTRPPVVRRIREKMAQVAGEGEVPRGREQLAKLEYLDATIKEVRFRPIMAFGESRILHAPWRLREWEIPPGTAVASALSMVHRRPDLYPEPHEFRPERFLGQRPDPYEWTPFGGGLRRCLGMAFALYEMRIVLAHLLARTVARSGGAGADPRRDRRVLHRSGPGPADSCPRAPHRRRRSVERLPACRVRHRSAPATRRPRCDERVRRAPHGCSYFPLVPQEEAHEALRRRTRARVATASVARRILDHIEDETESLALPHTASRPWPTSPESPLAASTTEGQSRTRLRARHRGRTLPRVSRNREEPSRPGHRSRTPSPMPTERA